MRSSLPVSLVTDDSLPLGLPNRLPSLLLRVNASFARLEIIARSFAAERDKALARTFFEEMLLPSASPSVVVKAVSSFPRRVGSKRMTPGRDLAQPGACRARQHLRLEHVQKAGPAVAVGEFLGSADGLFNAVIHAQFLFIGVCENFKPLIFRGLFVG